MTTQAELEHAPVSVKPPKDDKDNWRKLEDRFSWLKKGDNIADPKDRAAYFRAEAIAQEELRQRNIIDTEGMISDYKKWRETDKQTIRACEWMMGLFGGMYLLTLLLTIFG
ncbi:MAG: hypothetical protein ACR2PR_09315 [Pseudohongiellaceae bacterium]